MAETIDRDLNVNVSLPESALKALRDNVAENVAAGIKDGFKQFAKLKMSFGKGKGGEEDENLKKLNSETKKSSEESKKLNVGFKALGKTVAAVILALNLLSKMMESVEKMSTQLISQQTLFTDKNIMSLMQQTGQSSTEATATQRALDQLGITLSDIESGHVTEAQMDVFGKLRGEYIESIGATQEQSKSMFQAWQSFTLQVGTFGQKLGDMFVGMLGTSGAVERLTTALQPVMEMVGKIVEALMPLIPTLLDLVSSLIPALAGILAILAGILPPVVKLVQFLAGVLENLGGLLGRVVEFIGEVIETLTFGLVKIPKVQSSQILHTTSNVNSSTTQYVNNYNQPNNNLFNNDYVGAN